MVFYRPVYYSCGLHFQVFMLLELLSDGAVKAVTVGSCCNCWVCFFDSFIKRHCVGSIVVGRLIRYYGPVTIQRSIVIIIIIIIIVMLLLLSLVTGLFSPVLLFLNQRWCPPLKLQVSDYSIFRIMCDVPSIAVFCGESVECFPGVACRFFLKSSVTILVAPIFTGYYYYYYYYYYYHYHHHHLLYAGCLHLYSWDKPCR